MAGRKCLRGRTLPGVVRRWRASPNPHGWRRTARPENVMEIHCHDRLPVKGHGAMNRGANGVDVRLRDTIAREAKHCGYLWTTGFSPDDSVSMDLLDRVLHDRHRTVEEWCRTRVASCRAHMNPCQRKHKECEAPGEERTNGMTHGVARHSGGNEIWSGFPHCE
jgi:hypothetical protein